MVVDASCVRFLVVTFYYGGIPLIRDQNSRKDLNNLNHLDLVCVDITLNPSESMRLPLAI